MKQTAVNEFKDGLNLDLHPIVTPNTVLTDNLNGTFITYNGNEFCLQNDRGNTYTCDLTEGFVPIGAKEHGGIIYIVSVKDNLTEIGTFPGISDWDISEGILDYSYHSLGNLYTDPSKEGQYRNQNGFQAELGYNVTTPVTIEIQDSYDGSVNLIILGGENKPIIVNSGFSVLPEGKYKIIEREQNSDTNKYSTDKLLEQIGLIRTSDVITNIDLHGHNEDTTEDYILSGGQLKGGNYKFYIKFGDADYNQTDVIAESSGMISIFNGKNGDPSTISGTLLDERTDKMIGLDITGLNHTYSKIYVYYSREYSDTNGYRMTEYMMLNNPIDMISEGDKQTIWITGYEQEVPINSEELNVDYHTIDFAKAETQQANMLFLGNIGKDEATFDAYRDLRDWTLKTNVEVDCGYLNDSLETDSLYSQKLYYDVSNIYYNLGYYPGEVYRFGIVYIFNDNSLSPVFNVSGGTFKYNDQNELILDENYFESQDSENLCNKGIIVMPEFDEKHKEFSVIKQKVSDDAEDLEDETSNRTVTEPIYLKFTLSNDSDCNFKRYGIKGWFVVRQKRIPNEICQGISAKIDNKSHLPLVYNGDSWITQSFLSADRYDNDVEIDDEETHELNDVALRYDNATYMKSNKGMDFQSFLESEGVSTAGLGALWLARYTDTHAELLTKRDIERRDNWMSSTSHFWMIDAYENNVSQNEFKNSLRAGLNTVYITKFHILLDGSIQYANKGRKDQRPIEVTYLSTSDQIPSDIWVYPMAMHNKNYAPDILPDQGKLIATSGIINDYWKKYKQYLSEFGGSVERKLIKENINETDDVTYFSSDALISLDPCVDSTISSILDGNKFWIEKKYNTIILSDDSSGYYEYYGNNINEPDDAFEEESENGFDARAVFVNSDTAVKVVDTKAYSNIAGDPADISKFSYFTKKYLVKRKSYTISEQDKKKFALDELKPEAFTHQDADILIDPINDYKQANNINLIRGKFCPYVGIIEEKFPTNSVNVYSIKLKKQLNNLDIKVRAEDNSEYYCISPRFNIDDINQDIYGGDCFVCTSTIRIIRNFIDPIAPINENILKSRSWLHYITNMYYSGESGFDVKIKTKTGDGNIKDGNLVEFTEVNLSDVNTVDLGIWVTFRTLSSLNLGLRSQDYSHVDEMALLGSPRTFYPLNGASTATGAKMEESWLLNDGYNATVGRKRYNLFQDVPYTKSEFSNRIMFSNVNVTDAYTNGYRTFQGLSYKDYDKQYGEIVKLVPWGSNILCVMEHGIGLVTVNERALMQTTTGEAIHIYGHGVLPDNMTIISQDYGSKYPNSVIRTPIGVYGIDTDARKVWRISDKNGFETISDMKIETYLNDNLFTDKNSVIETVDVRTHYNAFKGDVMFTFYNTEKEYLIVPEEIELEEDEEILYEVKTNMDNVTSEIDDSDIIEWNMKDNKKYIKGKTTGNAQIRTGNSILNKITSILVKAKSTTPDVQKKHLTKIPSNTTVYTGDSRTYNFNSPINPSELEVSYDSNIVEISKTPARVKVQAIGSGSTSIVFKYGDEVTTCNMTINGDSSSTPSEPQVSTTEYCNVILHRPHLDYEYGSRYTNDCNVYVTYDGTRTLYAFTGGRDTHQLQFTKNSSVKVECEVSGYLKYNSNITINKDRMDIIPVLRQQSTLIINSISPSDAEVTVNGEHAEEGSVFTGIAGGLACIEASAEGYLPLSECIPFGSTQYYDVNLDEGDSYLGFEIDTVIYKENGSYTPSFGAPSGSSLTYTITRDGNTIGPVTISDQIYYEVPVKIEDFVEYDFNGGATHEGFSGTHTVKENSEVLKYHIEPTGYGSITLWDTGQYQYAMINEDPVWVGQRLHFEVGTKLTITPMEGGGEPFEVTIQSGHMDVDVLKHSIQNV